VGIYNQEAMWRSVDGKLLRVKKLNNCKLNNCLHKLEGVGSSGHIVTATVVELPEPGPVQMKRGSSTKDARLVTVGPFLPSSVSLSVLHIGHS
jgi:hypothetical protein